jgi:hypothetical protein
MAVVTHLPSTCPFWVISVGWHPALTAGNVRFHRNPDVPAPASLQRLGDQPEAARRRIDRFAPCGLHVARLAALNHPPPDPPPAASHRAPPDVPRSAR